MKYINFLYKCKNEKELELIILFLMDKGIFDLETFFDITQTYEYEFPFYLTPIGYTHLGWNYEIYKDDLIDIPFYPVKQIFRKDKINNLL